MPVRLVLADDHLVLRQALKALLERRGLEVVADEADGLAAVKAVEKLAPDVAVLDVAMPVLNGVDAAREIARHPRSASGGKPGQRLGFHLVSRSLGRARHRYSQQRELWRLSLGIR